MASPEPSNAEGALTTSLDHLPEHLRARTDFDVVVAKEGVLLPCYSQALILNSEILAGMLEDTDKEGWGAGVASALADASLEDARLFLAICHRRENVESFLSQKDYRELSGVMRLAHKLDAPEITKECANYLLASLKHLEAPVRWLGVAAEVGLADFADQCRGAALEQMIQHGHDYANSIKKVRAGADDWNSLPAAEYQRLMDGMLRAFGRASSLIATSAVRNKKQYISYDEWEKIVQQLQPLK